MLTFWLTATALCLISLFPETPPGTVTLTGLLKGLSIMLVILIVGYLFAAVLAFNERLVVSPTRLTVDDDGARLEWRGKKEVHLDWCEVHRAVWSHRTNICEIETTKGTFHVYGSGFDKEEFSLFNSFLRRHATLFVEEQKS
jgi:hypothetical protein